jgi:hypothetical protein
MLDFSLIKPMIRLGLKVWLGYFVISLLFMCYFWSIAIITIASATVKEVVHTENLEDVALGNPFLPYRNITPKVSGSSLHGYTNWTGEILSGTWEGIDYSTPAGTPLYAPAICPCSVEAVGFDGFIGTYDTDVNSQGTSYLLMVSEDKEYSVMYQHGIYTVTTGETVNPDTIIGEEASIGNSTGSHTHLAVKKNGIPIAANEYNYEIEKPEEKVFVASVEDHKSLNDKFPWGTVTPCTIAGIPANCKMSHYTVNMGKPIQDGVPLAGAGTVNCWQDCEYVSSGLKTRDLIKSGKCYVAAPSIIAFGTIVVIDGVSCEVVDRGGKIVQDGNTYWMDVLEN